MSLLHQPKEILLSCLSPFLNLRELCRFRSLQKLLREKLLLDQGLDRYAGRINCIVWIGGMDGNNKTMINLLKKAKGKKLHFAEEAHESKGEKEEIYEALEEFRGYIYWSPELYAGFISHSMERLHNLGQSSLPSLT